MSLTSPRIVYSLLTAVFLLLSGMMTLLSVANHRHQRLEDQTTDLQRNLDQQETRLKVLQKRLENCDTTGVSSLANSRPATPFAAE